jgi:hypothetical protein
MAAEIGPDPPLLSRIHDQPGTVHPRPDAQPLEPEERRTQVVRPHGIDHQLPIGDSRQADEAADLDMVGADRVRSGGTERPAPLHHVDVGPDAADRRAHRNQKAGQILDVRLGRGVAQDRPSLGPDRRHQRVLGTGDARLVQEDVGALEMAGLHFVPVAQAHLGTKLLEGEKMGIDAAAPYDVPARRREDHLSEPCKRGTRHQNGGADAGTQPRIEWLGSCGAGIDPHDVGTGPCDARAQIGEEREHRLDVADPGHVVEIDRPVDEQGGGKDRQGRILVARRADRAVQRTTAANLEAWRHGQRSNGGRCSVKRRRPHYVCWQHAPAEVS